jgi:hypothetical protein
MSGILEINEVEGLLDNREKFRRSAYADREPRINFLKGWFEEWSDEPVYARTLADEDLGLPEELFAAIRVGRNSESLGKWLRKKRDTITGGYRVLADDDGHGTMKWRLECVES